MIDADILIGMVRFVPQIRALGVRYVEHGENWVVLKMPWREDLVGFPDTGILAGGAIFTMLDNASGMAILCTGAEISNMATLDLRLDYLKPATAHKDVFARMECYKETRHVAFVRGVAYHDDPRQPIAQSVGTFVKSGQGNKSDTAEAQA